MKPYPSDTKREQDRVLDVVVDRLLAELVDDTGRVKISLLEPRRGWVRVPAERVIHERRERR